MAELRLPVILLFLFISFGSQAQSPYKMSLKADVPVALGSVGMFALSTHFTYQKEPLSYRVYPCSNIWKPERWICGQYSHAADVASDITLYTSYALPALLLIPKNTRKDWRTYALGAETMALTIGFTELIKSVTRRKRPYVYTDEASIDEVTSDGATRAFFSGHTSTSAAASFFFAKVYTDHYPNNRWKPWVWTAAATLPAVTGALRIRAGKHFLTDVLVGYVVGAGLGYLVPHLHRRKMPKTPIPVKL